MPACNICGEAIPEGSRTCPVCGSMADDMMPMGTMLGQSAPVEQTSQLAPVPLPPGGSYCPVCLRIYGAEYPDDFCSCGTELMKEAPQAYVGENLPMPSISTELPMAPVLDEEVPMAPVLDEEVPMAPVLDAEVPMAPVLDEPAPTPVALPGASAGLAASRPCNPRPAPGTPCLVLYGLDKQTLQYFALDKDTTTIGRVDAVAGNFPDVDLDQWFDRGTVRRISRQHALILRLRASKTFSLRPLIGNTGTQLEGSMVSPQQDYPLKPGQRIILGGVVRLKFEIA